MSASDDLKRRLGGEPDDLIELLGAKDVDTRGLALGELMARGKKGLPSLLKALKSDDAITRATAAEGLAQVGDPTTAGALAAALNDPNEKVRAQAASALSAMDDPRAIEALISTINNDEDVLHANFTRSSYALIGYGEGALPLLAPLLKAKDQPTRMHAYWALKMIVSRLQGNAKDDPHLQEWLDSYQPEAPAEQRDALATHLIAWANKSAKT